MLSKFLTPFVKFVKTLSGRMASSRHQSRGHHHGFVIVAKIIPQWHFQFVRSRMNSESKCFGF